MGRDPEIRPSRNEFAVEFIRLNDERQRRHGQQPRPWALPLSLEHRRERKDNHVRTFRTFLAAAAALVAAVAQGQTQLTIATVNNSDMIIMQRLSKQFETAHPDVKLNWVVLEENVLRERVTTDIATKAGSFDILTIGTYEAPIWGKRNWLVPFDDLPASYDVEGLIKPIRDGLSVNGKLYALPFYGESSFVFYRKDLFDKIGASAPKTYAELDEILPKLKAADPGVYPLCLRGKPGWGENMAYFDTLMNTMGGRWFDEKWKPQLTTAPWKKALTWYVDNMKKYGPPGATANGHNENRALFSTGKCALWIDATSAGGYISNPKNSQVADKVAYAVAPTGTVPNGAQWLWSWALGIPASTKHPAEAKAFVEWATSKEYIQLVANDKDAGWTSVPPGTRTWTYEQPEYQQAAPFAKLTLQAIQQADPIHSSALPIPYTGVQFVGIPEFQAIGTYVGQQFAAALAGKTSVDKALQNSQTFAERAMAKAGYYKK
jgi:sorbitol/mannitol transport system substrate-binding protein